MSWISGLLVASSLTGASVAPPAALPTASSEGVAERALLTWTAGEVRCSGNGSVAVTKPVRPLNALVWMPFGDRAVTLQFDIDDSGRPVSIQDTFAGHHDLGPSLAATRFAPTARTGCSITFTPNATSLASAEIADLISYTVEPISGQLPKQGWARIAQLDGGSGNCMTRPRPQPLLRAYPDFARMAGKPGVKEWTLVGYDIDAKGKPIQVRTLRGTGNEALEREAVKAVKNSRFTAGARQACRYPYWRSPEDVQAPPMPTPASGQENGCRVAEAWAVPPALRFPPAYARRRIDGWAILTYDVAPWGAVGNVKVVQAQPSDAFGRQAAQMLVAGKRAASEQGATGCVARVKFLNSAESSTELSGSEDFDAIF